MFREMSEGSFDSVDEDARPNNGRKVTFRSNLEDFEPGDESRPGSVSSQSIIEEDCEEVHDVEIIEQETETILVEELSRLTLIVQPETEESPTQAPTDTDVMSDKTEAEPVNAANPNSKIKRRRPKSSPAVVQNNPVKYKSCCDQKNSERDRNLPKYAGHISEYGLSLQQLQLKVARREKRRRTRQDIAFQRYQQELERNRRNEEAFARWMRVKASQLPKDKYANRYDDDQSRRMKRVK